MAKESDPVAFVERLADGDLEPTGQVTVQLRDERDRIVYQETKDNFVAKSWKAYSRALMRTRWASYAYNRPTGTSLNPFGWLTTPQLPADMLGCWNQTSAEDPTNENSPVIPATGLVAWATRWPFATPTYGRGNVNTTESTTSVDTVRFVFDWTSGNGNGTFQSIGWLGYGGFGMPLCLGGVGHRARNTISFTPSSVIGSSTAIMQGGGYIHTNGLMYQIVRRSGAGTSKIVSTSLTSTLSSSGLTIIGDKTDTAGSWTAVSGEFTPTSMSTSSSYATMSVLGRLSSSTVFSYMNLTSTTSQGRWGVVADGATTSTTYDFPTTGNIKGAVIGTTLYAGSMNSTTLYALNTSTGATISTTAIDSGLSTMLTNMGIASPGIQMMATDGTDLYIVYGQSDSIGWVLTKVNTSGVLQQVYGVIPHATYPSGFETAASPFAGTKYARNSMWSTVYDYGPFTVDANGTANTSEDLLSTGQSTVESTTLMSAGQIWVAHISQMLHYYDGALWFGYGDSGSVTSTTTHTFYKQGYDLGTRVRLASPVTKSSGQTMKITYDITIPGWF